MELSVHTVIMLFLAVYAYQGTCEVSPDFRLGSGAGATHSDSSFHDRLNPKYSRPRSSAEPMPIVAFALLWSTLAIATLMILWTYLVSWQDTASDYEFHNTNNKSTPDVFVRDKKKSAHRYPLELARKSLTFTYRKTQRAKQRRQPGIIGRRSWYIYCIAAIASLVESEALSAGTIPLRTTNPIQPLLHRIITTTKQLTLSPSTPSPTITFSNYTYPLNNITTITDTIIETHTTSPHYLTDTTLPSPSSPSTTNKVLQTLTSLTRNPQDLLQDIRHDMVSDSSAYFYFAETNGESPGKITFPPDETQWTQSKVTANMKADERSVKPGLVGQYAQSQRQLRGEQEGKEHGKERKLN